MHKPASRRAKVYVNESFAGHLIEVEPHRKYEFRYAEDYQGPAVSLTMPITERVYQFDRFPSYFEGVLPEGMMLEGLLRKRKLNPDDLFEQLLCVGEHLVGYVTVKRDL